MNSISNNKTRIIFCWVLLIVVCIGMTFIPKKNTQPAVPALTLDDADQVCISGALYESWMYVVADKQFLNDTIEILDNLKYEKSDKAVNMMDAHKVYQFTYSKGNKQIKTFIVDSTGMLCFKAGGESYKITSQFDFKELDTIVQEYQATKKTQNNSATNDQ